MSTTKYDNKYDQAVRKLADTYKEDFAEFVAGDERVHELMMDIAAVFVTEQCPIVSEDSQIDLAAELIMCITVRTVS